MTTTADAPPAVTVPIVRLYVEQAREKNYRSGVIGLRARPEWSGPESFEVDGEQAVRVVPCVSALAVREALTGRDQTPWLVILTDRPDEDLGEDILAYFVDQRVRTPVLWDVVKDRFRARDLDPRLTAEGRELAQALLAATPSEGWPPARSGFLSRDAAFEALSSRVLGLPGDRLDEGALLEWSRDPRKAAGLDRLDAAVREKVRGWVGRRLGPVGEAVMEIAARGNTADSVPLGLAAGALASSDGERAVEARGRFGQKHLDRTLSTAAARQWAEASRSVIERMLTMGARHHIDDVLGRAEELLDDTGAADLAASSDVLPRGLAARLHHFALTIDGIDGPEAARAALAAAEDAYEQLARHGLAESEPEATRVERALMALRLVRWLADDTSPSPATVGEAVERQVTGDAWVDRARAHAWAGDPDATVSQAYRTLYETASAFRERHDRHLATLLARDAGGSGTSGEALPIEKVVPEIVLGVAREGPVLMLVLDGLSTAIAAELVEGATRRGWVEMVRSGRQHRLGALAAFPTVTDVSRSSLFAGAVMRGSSTQERSGLENLAQQRGLSATLFHKGDLDVVPAGAELPPRVEQALSDTSEHHIVAAVLNAVDDELGVGDPGRPPWTPGRVTHLEELLRAAEATGRVVVITSDHGHVVERRDGELRRFADATSPRWRPAAGTPAGDGEVTLQGDRVLSGGKIIAPWQETLRYLPLKSGYHGGASAAEVAVPVVVLARASQRRFSQKWEPAPEQAPPWWFGVVSAAPTPAAPAPVPPKHAPEAPAESGRDELVLESAEEPASAATAPATADAASRASEHDLADRVVASATFREQRNRARRGRLDDTEVVSILRALLASGGELTAPALAATAGFPEYRLSGKIAGLQRLLNVEGYEVVRRDIDANRVVLDERLLRQQFGMADGAEGTA